MLLLNYLLLQVRRGQRMIVLLVLLLLFRMRSVDEFLRCTGLFHVDLSVSVETAQDFAF